jgi:hypothetical protein
VARQHDDDLLAVPLCAGLDHIDACLPKGVDNGVEPLGSGLKIDLDWNASAGCEVTTLVKDRKQVPAVLGNGFERAQQLARFVHEFEPYGVRVDGLAHSAVTPVPVILVPSRRARISLPSRARILRGRQAEVTRAPSPGMSFAFQVIDILIAGVLAGATAFLLAGLAPTLATDIGVLFAALYYFSRNPWGGNGEEINEGIDKVYASLVPGTSS